ncbi:hypothetical protein BD310DRAFT_941351 [Dichomitus squalens]|uniref:Uncharacterized protein n=1 Tax=Dichomitus squalens TaxID=114155 RepID=A0A4Q9PB18_9APHY|nr:hypothetical protein BD310DRAFT_941351 [Dichomitus squalens]
MLHCLRVLLSTILPICLLVIPRVASLPGTSTEGRKAYTYRGSDFPTWWNIPSLEDVYLSHEDSIHYALETDLGAAEWKSILPSGGSTLYFGEDLRPFTLSMFHQLRCLDILRDILVEFHYNKSPDATYKNPEMAKHCMNYLRQTVICRADTRLEHVRAASGPRVVVSDLTHSCKDWTAVYEAAERNYQYFLENR